MEKDNNLLNQKDICPICGINKIYKNTRKIKNGYTEFKNGYYKFHFTGWKTVTDEWWSCKECAKKYSVKDYSQLLIEIFN